MLSITKMLSITLKNTIKNKEVVISGLTFQQAFLMAKEYLEESQEVKVKVEEK